MCRIDEAASIVEIYTKHCLTRIQWTPEGKVRITHTRKLINEHPDWEFVEVYADPGLSGTSLKKRDNFNRM
ncbi:hypothetical protein FWF74_00075, partial [Candidatus Saccharibacteria bacterium]|nr:hypothetical protein [Candidatus Saccharibacteria bacterium]